MNTPNSFWILLLFLLSHGLAACGDSNEDVLYSETQGDVIEDTYARNQPSSPTQPPAAAPLATSESGKRIQVFDKGMNMPIASVAIPPGWRLSHDIVTNTNTAAYERYLIDIQSPNGMLIRGLGSAMYNHAGGSSFDSLVERIAMAGAQGIENLSYGDFEPNQRLMAQPAYQRRIQGIQAGMQLQTVQLSFTGTAAGRPVEGRLEVDHTLFMDGAQHSGGMVNVALLISPPGQIESLVKVSDAINQSVQVNPAYDGARARVIDAVSARMTAEHHQRMARNKAQFDSHQSMMKSRYESTYTQNDRWLQNFKNSGNTSNGSGSGYSDHDKFIDAIGETTSFNDPDSGNQLRQDGQFDRWATDGQGNYVGSDDPNFEPSAMDGNWQEAPPLQ